MSNSSEMSPQFSIGEFYPKQIKNCDYCSSYDSCCSYGLYTPTLRVEDYQDMIDRGWRRCGKYCYKIVMDKSCCPTYTIKCAAKDFKLSKTQKKIIKKFNNFLITGTVTKTKMHKNIDITHPMDVNLVNEERQSLDDSIMHLSGDSSIPTVTDARENVQVQSKKKETPREIVPDAGNTIGKTIIKKSMKAKQMRIQRKRQKLQNLGLSEEEICKKLVEKKKYPVVKTLEDFLKESESQAAVHNLRISLVRSCPRSSYFNRTFAVAFDLFRRYQLYVQNDDPERITQSQFERFLVISPLQATNEYGSYHQQYWLDDKLIAVGVIDILPKCVSSVYFFYDPDYRHLCLGTYGALRELEFTRSLSIRFPDLIYYYMGFYIHSCVKMKYKGAFKPSYLLCPEVYTWHPIEKCLPKIDATKYSRLNEDPKARDTNSDINPREVFVFYKIKMTLSDYLNKINNDPKEREEIMECARLLGKTCAANMFLVRSNYYL